MNTYLIPIFEKGDSAPWIKTVKARSMEEAEDKIMNSITQEYDLDVPADWEDFNEIAYKNNLYIGYIKDLEEF